MKKTLFAFILAIIFYTPLQAQTEADLKLALSTVAQSYIGWQKNSCFYFTAGDYIKDENSGQVIGQKFTNPQQSAFSRLELVKENGQFPTATMDGNLTFLLTWQGNRIKNIKGKNLYHYDYNISYGASGEIEKMNGANGEEIIFGYEGNQLKGITAMGVYKGKPYPISVSEVLEESDNGFKMTKKMYTRGKPMKDKHIRQTINCSCEKLGDKQYRSVNGYGNVVMHTFDDTERLIKKIIDKTNNSQQVENYFYGTAGNVSRKEISKKEGGVFKEKEIRIFETPGDTADLEEWESRKGLFRFNEKNELIYEAINTKYREKKSGVWTDWKQGQYCGVK